MRERICLLNPKYKCNRQGCDPFCQAEILALGASRKFKRED